MVLSARSCSVTKRKCARIGLHFDFIVICIILNLNTFKTFEFKFDITLHYTVQFTVEVIEIKLKCIAT